MPFVTRGEWGAKDPKDDSPAKINDVYGAGYHWEGPHMGWPWDHSLCDDKVRSIQRFHMVTRGWNDIAYSFLYCGHDYIYEGRGWGVRTAANGTNWGNEHFHAFCYLGGDGDGFPPEALRAAVWLAQEQARKFPRAVDLRPHSAFKATRCPGDEIRGHLASGRISVVAAPAPAPTPVPPPSYPKETVAVEVRLPLLREGHDGQHVKTLQFMLRDKAGADVAVDGDFGPRTSDAVRNFQRFFGLSVDGVVGKDTWPILLAIPFT